MTMHTWAADACRSAGLRVIEVGGWKTRGGDSFDPRGLVLHHTAGAATGEIPSLSTIVNGRADLPGPLANFALGRSGTVYVAAAGRANHAGAGGWRGLVSNASVWGIEAENTGLGEPWPDEQLDAFHRLAAVLAAGTPFAPDAICAHREWAPGRKIDPTGIDPAAFRARVAELLEEDDMALTAPQAAQLAEARQNAIDAKNYAKLATEQAAELLAQVERLAAPGVDLDALAAKVADVLAARLAG